MKLHSRFIALGLCASFLVEHVSADSFTINTRHRVRDAAGLWAVSEQKVLWEFGANKASQNQAHYLCDAGVTVSLMRLPFRITSISTGLSTFTALSA